jgi:hypothetical protein
MSVQGVEQPLQKFFNCQVLEPPQCASAVTITAAVAATAAGAAALQSGLATSEAATASPKPHTMPHLNGMYGIYIEVQQLQGKHSCFVANISMHYTRLD